MIPDNSHALFKVARYGEILLTPTSLRIMTPDPLLPPDVYETKEQICTEAFLQLDGVHVGVAEVTADKLADLLAVGPDEVELVRLVPGAEVEAPGYDDNF